jgi:hypothetical protein
MKRRGASDGLIRRKAKQRAISNYCISIRSAGMMSPNMNNIDRGLRLVAGLALLALGAFGPLGWWSAIGLIPIGTALIGWCPAYRLLGLDTLARPRGS